MPLACGLASRILTLICHRRNDYEQEHEHDEEEEEEVEED